MWRRKYFILLWKMCKKKRRNEWRKNIYFITWKFIECQIAFYLIKNQGHLYCYRTPVFILSLVKTMNAIICFLLCRFVRVSRCNIFVLYRLPIALLWPKSSFNFIFLVWKTILLLQIVLFSWRIDFFHSFVGSYLLVNPFDFDAINVEAE